MKAVAEYRCDWSDAIGIANLIQTAANNNIIGNAQNCIHTKMSMTNEYAR